MEVTVSVTGRVGSRPSLTGPITLGDAAGSEHGRDASGPQWIVRGASGESERGIGARRLRIGL